MAVGTTRRVVRSLTCVNGSLLWSKLDILVVPTSEYYQVPLNIICIICIKIADVCTGMAPRALPPLPLLLHKYSIARCPLSPYLLLRNPFDAATTVGALLFLPSNISAINLADKGAGKARATP